MFYAARRILWGLPWLSAAIGLAGQPVALALPPALVTLHVLARDRAIRRRMGAAAWPSDGFARHVLVDDHCKLAILTLLSVPLFFLGLGLRAAILG